MASYPSTGEAAAVGFERGIGIGRGLRQDEERRKQHEEELGLRRRTLEGAEEERKLTRERQARIDQQTEQDRELKAAEAEWHADRDAFGGLYHGGERGEKLTAADRKLRESGARVSQLRARYYTPKWREKEEAARRTMEDLKTNRKRPEDIPESELYTAMSYSLKRPVSELFRNEDGSPSELGAAADQLMQAIEQRDEPSMLKASNVVFRPLLQVGVGEIGPHGGEVISKEIVAAKADPRANGKIMPTLLVKVRLPNGKEAQYHAPITEGRSASGDDDRVVSLDVGDVIDHVARIQAAEKVVNSPEAAGYLARGQQQAQPVVEEGLQEYFRAGGKPFEHKAPTVTQIDLGGTKEIRTHKPETGEMITETRTKTIEPGKQEDLATRLEIATAKLEVAKLKAEKSSAEAVGPEAKRHAFLKTLAKELGVSMDDASTIARERGYLGVKSPEEIRAENEARAAAAAKESDTRAAQRAAPGTAPPTVRAETELRAKAIRDTSLPKGVKFGKYVQGQGLPVLAPKGFKDPKTGQDVPEGKQIGWYR